MNEQYISKKLSFWQLLSIEDIERIEIPIIQRDYAQGRDKFQKIRTKFISSLKNALTEAPIELDFIYGSIKNKTFLPLDGQQRLTTLFLIHWYIASSESQLITDTINILNKFTYETRVSSREFCENLINNRIDFNNLLKPDENKNNGLSKTIKNAHWFYNSWLNDPTIKSMLTMLDEIHLHFKDENNIWDKLIQTDNNPITFYYIVLENFGLSDDLYIKMNARGKQLSEFETFKAELEKKINSEDWDNKKSLTDTFEHKADTDWTDLFWKKEKDNFDKAYFNFIVYSLMPAIALKEIKGSNISPKDKEKLIQKIYNNLENITIDVIDENAYKLLYNSLEAYASNIDFIINLQLWNYLKKEYENFFELVLSGDKLEYQQIAFLFAQTLSLIKNGNINEDWMRVIRNIINNSTIDSAESFIGIVNLINELSKGINDIYNYLSSNTVKSRFAEKQVKEEIIKAKIIEQNDDKVKQLIFETEDTSFCKGKISFSLFCINAEGGNNFNASKLEQIKNIINEHLSNNDITNKFRSALFTIKDNEFYNYWRSWLYVVNSNKRCLIENIEDLKVYAYNNNFRDYLKVLLNNLTKSNLDAIINNFDCPKDMPKWKCKLIKETDLLDYSERHFIAIPEDESCCYLIPKSRVANNKEGKNRLKRIE